jgi:AcrR family transcriptional regulator
MLERDDTRQRVLEAAGPIFAAKGLEAASVREICDKAGANISAINYYFRSKQQLYVETVRHAYQSCAASAPLPQWPAATPPAQRLRDFIRMELIRVGVNDTTRPNWHGLLIWREVAQPTEACAEFVREFVRPCADMLQGILDDLLPAEVPQHRRHLIAGSIIGQCLHYHHARHVIPLLLGDDFRGLDLEQLTDHITAFSLAAIRGLSGKRSGGGKS